MSGATEAKPLKANGSKNDIPDTPGEFLESFLSQLKQESSSLDMPESTRTLIDQSLELASGMLTYPVAMSTQLSADALLLAKKTSELDFEALYNEGKTGRFKFFKEMSSNVLQGNFLKMLVRMTGAKRVLEIGTFTGFAALNMAEGLPSDGRLVTLEMFPFFVQLAQDFFAQTAQRDKIEVQTGPALELLKALGEKGETFDFIFIDAAKPEYKDYLSLILAHGILAPKGTMAFDNTMYKGATFMKNFPNAAFSRGGPAVQEFNQIVMKDPRVVQVMLPTQDGVTIVRRVGE